ncbi:putative WRKY transcription factor 70 [Morus notabilis]|uniref:Putative WRKY transcription factor 70 n=1 Tax=Morus notabilis TaxID=981085 RepID=W9QTT4_9ROSA|nr:probable WRKY transcription factor 46 [Morus notabilis]EXB54246.1 putative WRKY transcription factor 70 [Morus notabilis]
MACSVLPENLLSVRQKMIDELIQGREIANQLRTVLFESVFGDDWSVVISAEYLVSRIMESFTNTLFMLNQNDVPNEVVVSQIQRTSSRVDSPCFDGQKSEDFAKSCWTSVSTTLKHTSGCCKRRKTVFTWQRETSTLMDDGHAWRKYGQKMILKGKHPRHYYRCTHKNDQGCQATKQVQKIQDNPPIFRTKYYGHHRCGNLLRASELDFDSTSPNQDSSLLLSFKNANLNNLTSNQAHSFFSAFTKHVELKDHMVPSCDNNMIVDGHINNQASSDYIVTSANEFHYHHRDHDDIDDLTAFDYQSPGNMAVLSPNLDFGIEGDLMPFDTL